MPASTSQLTAGDSAIPWWARFEWAWQNWRYGDVLPAWERCLPETAGSDDEHLIHLLRTDLEFRVKASLPALLTERYFAHPRLQHLAEHDSSLKNELVRWEYQQRWKHGQRVRRQDYLDRFPELADRLADLRPRWNCPTCRQAGIPADEELPERLTCPRCSSATVAENVFPLAAPAGLTPTQAGGRQREPDGEVPVVPGYEILEQLGKGGMGIVFKARQLNLNRVVALKWIRAGEDVIRFRAEAESAARLQHPGIVQIFEVGAVGNRPYFTLEFVPGGSLDKALNGVPQPPRRAALIVEAVAQAVHEAHRHGVLHRDLKPANILLAPRAETSPEELPWELKIADFGLAKRVTDEPGQTQSGTVLGTPSYMAPEQALARKDLGPAADVYALGVLLYEALTGVQPFRAASTWETLQRLVNEEPVPPSHLQPGLPRDLETICLKCLNKEPERRGYATATALAEDLGRYLRAEPVLARPVGQLMRGWRWCRRNPMTASLTAAIVLLLVTITVVSVVLGESARKEAEEARQARGREADRAKEARQETERARTAEGRERQKGLEEKAAREKADEEEKKAKRALYVSQLALAQSYWKEGRVAAAREKLADAAEQRDSWEHRYLHTTMNHRGQKTLSGHTNEITSVAYSPDGTLLASVDRHNEVRVWDVANAQVLFKLIGHTTVAFSPDGKRLATAYGGQLAKVWDVATGKEVLTLKGHTSQIRCVAFSPDGQRLATASFDQTVKLRNAALGQEIHTLRGHTSAVVHVAFSPDGKLLASASWDKTVKVWDAASGKDILSHKKHASEVLSLAFSPDGKRLATASMDRTVKVYDVFSQEKDPVHFTFEGHTFAINCVVFSPDGKRLVTASGDQTVGLWDASTGRNYLTLKGHSGSVNSLCFSPDGNCLATASSDYAVKLWDTGKGQDFIALYGHGSTVMSVAFSRDGKRLATASADGSAIVWDVTTGHYLLALGRDQISFSSVAFSPDGKRLATASFDKTVKLWDAATGRCLHTLAKHKGDVRIVAYSPDGKRLASASADSTVKVWDADTGQELFTFDKHAGTVFGVAFSPDSKLITSAGMDQTVKLWDAATGQVLREFPGHVSTVLGVTFSPDGVRLASAGGDKMVKIWETATGQLLFNLKGHTEGVECATFSSDGKRLVSASGDQTVKVWDAEIGQELLSLKGHTSMVKSVAFSPDGKWLASASGDKTVKLWDATMRLGPPLPQDKPLSGFRWWIAFDRNWYEQQTREAEEQADWLAAAFYGHWLQHERPWDAAIRLRRAYALSQSNRLTEAAAEALTAAWLDPQVRWVPPAIKKADVPKPVK